MGTRKMKTLFKRNVWQYTHVNVKVHKSYEQRLVCCNGKETLFTKLIHLARNVRGKYLKHLVWQPARQLTEVYIYLVSSITILNCREK